jgi:hypothetical protein
VKITARIPTTTQYGYIEIEADNGQEFVAAVAEADAWAQLVGQVQISENQAPITSQQAEQNLVNGGLVNPNAPGLATQATQPAQQQAPAGGGKIGVDPVSGKDIWYNPTGKFGPNVKADIYANWKSPVPPTIDQAVQTLQRKREWNAQKAQQA